jgi:hypothetical protein
MDGARFDHIARVFSAGSRRTLVRGLLGAALAGHLLPAGSARAQLAGIVVLGGACDSSPECRQREMQLGAICADNGFASDGPLNCCLEEGCCATDADCCGDRRCAPGADVCNFCALPPFPTRFVGQVCDIDSDCVPAPAVEIACADGRCACLRPEDLCRSFQTLSLPDVPDEDLAFAFAEELSRLESEGRYDDLYDLMHPHAREIIPRAAVVGWYEEDFVPGTTTAKPVKLRFVSWTWPVTGQTYPGAVEIALRQDDRRDEVRLVKDGDGNWRWFFGRDRDFVNEQIARFVD